MSSIILSIAHLHFIYLFIFFLVNMSVLILVKYIFMSNMGTMFSKTWKPQSKYAIRNYMM